MATGQSSQQAFFGTSALLFTGSAALTIAWCSSTSAMGRMPMPGGWSMSMAWMRMSGQTWIEAAISFLIMWGVMMVAMMLPSLAPMLWRYRQAVGYEGESRLGRLIALVGLAYFFVWTIVGLIVFPLGVALATAEMEIPALARAVPVAIGAVILFAGALQCTAWKARHLSHCRGNALGDKSLPADTSKAWRTGLRFGFHCCCSCLNLTAILLVVGVMNLYVMAAVTAAITAERLAPESERVTRVIGATALAAGLSLLARTVGGH